MSGGVRRARSFNCADPATWPAPTTTLAGTDDQYATVTVTAWAGLHPKQHRHPGHGSRGPWPIVRGRIVCVQVERVPARTRPPKVLWLWRAGPGRLDLELAWRAYVRRFDLEHTVRFCKQTLGWTTPTAPPSRPGRPVDLAGAGRLHPAAPHPPSRHGRAVAVGATPPARPIVALPGPPGFPRLLCALGSPAAAPKPSGRSPRPAQGPLLRTCQALPGDQEAHHQPHQEGPREADRTAKTA
jgi:hypothetical protein